LNESLYHHEINGRKIHPDARSLIINNVFHNLKSKLEAITDPSSNKPSEAILDVPEIHDLLICLCKRIEEDGRLLM
jgi:hypothetical protein